jgi:hypothetical protein
MNSTSVVIVSRSSLYDFKIVLLKELVFLYSAGRFGVDEGGWFSRRLSPGRGVLMDLSKVLRSSEPGEGRAGGVSKRNWGLEAGAGVLPSEYFLSFAADLISKSRKATIKSHISACEVGTKLWSACA